VETTTVKHSATAGRIAPPAADATQPADFPGAHNVVAYYAGLYGGSVPDGEVGFETLEKLGVRTIISVDGSAPDVELAKAHGMRYVHLPVGYKGVSAERTLEIARVIHDLPGPVYLHCHHGKHRSAGALGAAAVTLGYLTPEQAAARMKVSGTAENYRGLYKCVADATPADAARLSTASSAFPSISKISGFTQTMVVVDEQFDYIKAIEKAKWTVPSDHPDLVPTAVAGELHDLLRGLQEDPDVTARPDDFKQWLKDSAAQALAIEDELSKPAPSGEALAAQFKLLNQSCKQCHAKYRD
jgi:cytochrome c556